MVFHAINFSAQISTYNLQIRATDSGVPELMSFALVQVQVNDVNDNPPLFSQHNYSAFVHVSIVYIISIPSLIKKKRFQYFFFYLLGKYLN